MEPFLSERFGNPSSAHQSGRSARDAVERARDAVAELIGAERHEMVFTSGGTEGDNLAILGAAQARREQDPRRKRVITSALEHPAVRGAAADLARLGFDVDFVSVGPAGEIDPRELERECADDTALVSVQLANHELGNVYPVSELAAVAHAAGAWFHSDAVQAVGKIPVDVRALGVDLLTLSAHKIYGPKGAGALFIRSGVEPRALLYGGHQERERRPGTENVPGVVGLGEAARLVGRHLADWSAHTARLRDRLEQAALAAGARRFGAAPRVPNTSNIGFAGVEGELLMINLDLEGVEVSTGAACTSGSIEPSPVILALGVPRAEAATATRFSLGHDNSSSEIDRVVELLPVIIDRVRAA